MKFDDFNLDTLLLMSIYENGYHTPTPIQEKIIPTILAGKNVVGRSETGSGKTLAFLIPIFNMLDLETFGTQALIICPTRELSFQVSEEAKKLAKKFDERIKVATLNGGMNFDDQRKMLKKGAKIVVGTIGRIEEHLNDKHFKTDNLKVVCLDEADEMLERGFKVDVDYVLERCPKNLQILLFSATFPTKVKEIISKFIQNPEYVEIGKDSTTVETITQYYIFNKDKVGLLKDLIRIYGDKKLLIFANTKKKVEELYEATKHLNKINYIHSDIMQNERHKSMQNFKHGKTNVMIATDVASRGIDISEIFMVINFELPIELEYYIHRVGRTARAGKGGIALTLINNKVANRKIIELADILNTEITEVALVDGKLCKSEKTYIPQDKPSGLWKNGTRRENPEKSKSIAKKTLEKNKEKTNNKNTKGKNNKKITKQKNNNKPKKSKQPNTQFKKTNKNQKRK